MPLPTPQTPTPGITPPPTPAPSPDIPELTPISSDGELSQSQKENNATIIYNILSESGWEHNAICAVLGNMEVESKLNPKIDQAGGGTGFGIVQFTHEQERLFTYLEENGYEKASKPDLEARKTAAAKWAEFFCDRND